MENPWLLFFTLLSLIPTLSSRILPPDEDVDLEQFLADYYDDLVNEFISLKNDLMGDKKKIEEVKEREENFETLEKKFDDDYPADAPAPEAPGNDFNLTWQILANGSEDTAFVKVQRESETGEEATKRSKELRLSAIRSTILGLRGGNPEINSTVPSTKVLQEIVESTRGLRVNASTNSYTEKVQSFYPSCDVPKHTDEEAWADESLMNLLFDVTYPNPTPGSAISVQSAKLRLYKISQNTTAESKGLSLGVVRHTPPEDEKLLRVSVYWYTRTLRKNRVKRKLMDSHMFNAVKDEWMEFNIRTAVRTWKDFGKNYGLVVTVEDEDGQILRAHDFIKTMNCSKDASTVKPIPSMLIDATKEYLMEHPDVNQTQNDSANTNEEVNPFQYPSYHFPQLDVCTVEVPVHETTAYNTRISNDAALKAVAKAYNNTNRFSTRRNDEERTALFNTVGVGVPSSGNNRNNLVPILTKSDVETSPEDVRMKNELRRVQGEILDQPRRRHSRKYVGY